MDFEHTDGGSAEGQLIEEIVVSEQPLRQSCDLVGNVYRGTGTSARGQISEVTFNVILQTCSGDLSGSFGLRNSKTPAAQLFQFQGAINREGLFVLHGTSQGDRIAVISGSARRGGLELSGNFVVKEPGFPLNAGTFCATRN